jgi:hypothetical protein
MSRSNIKIKSIKWLGAILFALAIAAPASAQVRIEFGRPQVPGFSNNYPWFNDVSQYQTDQSFQHFLAYHPSIARELAQNPALLYNANWRSHHSLLAQYLANHPYVWQALNRQNWAQGPGNTQWGDYDNQHQWHDAYWWHHNNPNWFYDNHQNWASLDSRWLDQDGAYDQQRQWHYGEWWYNQNPSWVTTNHPTWLTEHQNWETQSEQQTFRQRHAMLEQNQQNQQRATDARQANLEQQQNMRQENQRQQQANQRQNRQNQLNEQRATDQRQANLQQQQNTRQENQAQKQANQDQGQATHQEQKPKKEKQNGHSGDNQQ